MEEKTLVTLFNKYKVIVPEIQREYVWGNNNEVLNKFIEDLFSYYSNSRTKKYNIGFVYSYQPNKKSPELFLIDGQQRITTLVLIAFCCAVKEKRLEFFSKMLRLDEPIYSFSYRVRSSTENFMFDLFTKLKCFKSSDVVESIKSQKWFFEQYENDTSVSSMISALKIIFDELSLREEKYFDFIVHSVGFWFFNVGETSQGEELYITMNSRGESLTNSEQIKPILFEKIRDSSEKKEYGKKWDNWEEYFFTYLNKKKNDRSKIIRHDNFLVTRIDLMMDRFLQTILQLEHKTQKFLMQSEDALRFTQAEKFKLDLVLIEEYFQSLIKVVDFLKVRHIKEDIIACLFEDSQENKYLYPFVALLSYMKMHPDTKVEEIEPLRIYQIVRNAVRKGVINYLPLIYFLSELKTSGKKEVYDFLLEYHLNENDIRKPILDKQELQNIQIILSFKDLEIEQLFWDTQEELEYLLSGSLCGIWYDAFEPNFEWSNLVINQFKERKKLVVEIFNRNNICKHLSNPSQLNEIDNSLIARALLTIGDFSIYSGGSNWCLGYDQNWKRIFIPLTSQKILSILISQIYSHEVTEISTAAKLQNVTLVYCEECRLKDVRYYIIKYPDCLQATEEGNNILTFMGEKWKTFRVEVLSKVRLSSYHVNPFATAVFNRIDKIHHENRIDRWAQVDYSTGLMFVNGIGILTDNTHSWNIVYNGDLDNMTFPDGFMLEKSKLSNGRECLRYSINANDDLIERGVELTNALLDYYSI